MTCRNRDLKSDSDAGQSAGTFFLFSMRGRERCQQKDCPCGRSKKFYDSSSSWVWPTGRSHAVARSTTVRSPITCSRAKAAGLESVAVARDLDETELEARLFPARRSAADQPRPASELAARSMKNCTATSTSRCSWSGRSTSRSNPDGYQYSRFCELYQQWTGKLDLVLRQEHRAGEKLFVDYAGQTVPIIDSKTGEIHGSVDLRGRSGRQQLHLCRSDPGTRIWPRWIGSHVRALEFLGAVRRCSFRIILKTASSPSLPLRTGSESHLSGDGRPLWHGRHSGARAQTS